VSLDLLPATGETVPLRRLFRLVNGGTPGPEAANWEGDVVWVTPADLSSVDGGIATSSKRTLTAQGLSTGSALVPQGALVVSTRAPIGYVVRAGAELTTNQGCKSLIPLAEVDTRYFQYVLLASRPGLVALGNGTTFSELSGSSLLSARVPAPDVAAQRRAAAFLDEECARIDELITEQQRQLDLLVERRQAELNAILLHGGGATSLKTVHVPWPVEVPEDWSVMSLGLCADLVTVGIVVNPSAYYEPTGVPCLRGLNIRPGKVSEQDLVYMSPASNELHAKSILRRGDVVIVRTGNAGAAAVVPDWAMGGNAIDLLLLRPGNRFVPQFLEYVINSNFARDQITYRSVGALQAHFNVGALSKLKVPCPPLGVQQRLAAAAGSALQRLDALAAEIRASSALLKEHKQALITAVVTGQKEVA